MEAFEGGATKEIDQMDKEIMKRKAIALLERMARYLSGYVRGGAIEIIKDYNDEAPSITVRIKLDPKNPPRFKLIYGEREY